MQYTAPHYYSRFKCIAGECPDTCCAGWQIVIDDRSLKKYKRQKGILRNRLHNEIDWKEGTFRQYEGRCAFLNGDNLCDLYLEGGSKMFCRTCRMYPRHIEEFEGLKEVSLSLSCPAAAELILGSDEPVRFITKDVEKMADEEYEEFDYLLFTKLEDARDLILRILQDRNIRINVRFAFVLALAHDLQQRIDKNALYEADSLIERYQNENAVRWFEDRVTLYERDGKREEKRMKSFKAAFSVLDGLEVLKGDWTSYLENAKDTIFTAGPAVQPEIPDGFDVQWEQLMVYFVYTYFCGAVYDRQAYSKMKFALMGTLLIREISRAVWIQNKRSKADRDAAMCDLMEAARRYAREIEHSDSNKNMVEERLKNESNFGIESFLQMF
ncbi:flagellin lysine-N-methylase [Faecalicatena orotica]|uniref:flagellin lysine-N-methylase n=1 Tax=Faecalicatena orotica TaxID=1544 RepID=UPI003216EEB5